MWTAVVRVQHNGLLVICTTAVPPPAVLVLVYIGVGARLQGRLTGVVLVSLPLPPGVGGGGGGSGGMRGARGWAVQWSPLVFHVPGRFSRSRRSKNKHNPELLYVKINIRDDMYVCVNVRTCHVDCEMEVCCTACMPK